LLTAHHADDNAETLLMNFFRGTGVAGIRGILPAHSHFIRPLLFATKLELMRFAKDSRLSWVEDSSNSSDDYTRNYIRHQVIPAVRDVFPKFEENLQDNIERFREIELLYHQSIDYHKKRLMYVKDNEVHLPVLTLSQSKPLNTIVYEILKDFGFSAAQTKEVIQLLDSESGRFVESPTHRVIRNRKWLIVAPVSSEEAETIVLEGPVKFMATSDFSFTMEEADRPAELPTAASMACLDRELLKFPLILRKWKQGDYFYPLGMKKKKKVSRLLIDLKLSKTEKEKVWVLEMNKKIVWVVGHRIDDRYKVSEATSCVLLFKATSL
jgi:tRNA(Ile)-lysidine synthase